VLIERGYHRGRKTTSCSTSQMCPVLSLSMGNEGRSVRLARTQQHKKTPAHLYHRALQLSIQSVSSTMQGLKLAPPLTCRNNMGLAEFDAGRQFQKVWRRLLYSRSRLRVHRLDATTQRNCRRRRVRKGNCFGVNDGRRR